MIAAPHVLRQMQRGRPTAAGLESHWDHRLWRFAVWAATGLLAIMFLVTGCASSRSLTTPARQFNYFTDTFSYSNGLVWEYRYDSNGKWATSRREPKPKYSQHCFVVSRSACQFFENATFRPDLPRLDEEGYRVLVRKVVHSSLLAPLPPGNRIVIPGYAHLRSFSKDWEQMLQAECGGAWRCYFQRGNWRIVFPFSRRQQDRVARRLQEELDQRGALVVHLVRFPQLSINHAVVVFGARPVADTIEFATYDPNDAGGQTIITFNRKSRTFFLPSNAYFPGGRVDVYPIYDRLLY